MLSFFTLFKMINENDCSWWITWLNVIIKLNWKLDDYYRFIQMRVAFYTKVDVVFNQPYLFYYDNIF